MSIKKIFKINKTKNLKSLLIIIVFSLALSLCMGIFLQYSQGKGGIPNSMLWLRQSFFSFILSTIFIFSILILSFSLIGNFYISSLISLLGLGSIGYANYKKLRILGEPIYPVDFYQVRYLSSLFKMIGGKASIAAITSIALILIFFYLAVKNFPKVRVNVFTRILLLFLSSFIIYSYTTFNNGLIKIAINRSSINIVLWNQPLNYELNGFVLGLLSNFQNKVMGQPENYNETTISEIVEKYKNEAEILNSNKIKTSEKPNIVFIMSESFWDPTRFESVTFSEDPMESLREIMDSSSSGWLLSPEFGGNTANVEFEALTSLSMYNLLPGSIPYQQTLDKTGLFPSIVSTLGNYGYNSIAIHPYNKTFYKRNRVYNYFGFNEFIGEDDMKYTERLSEGAYISDQAVISEIADKITESDAPVFIHAVTMQNHSPYNSGKNGENSISVMGLNEKSNLDLSTYSEGIKQSSIAIKNLMDRLSEIEEATVVVFFGDHLPGINETLYEETSFSVNNVFNSERLISETPLFIYSNYPLEHSDLNTLSPAYLGTTVFNIIDMPYSPYYAMLEKLKEQLPGLKLNLLIDSEGNEKSEPSEEEMLLLNDYRLIQYDLMLGKQYSLPGLF